MALLKYLLVRTCTRFGNSPFPIQLGNRAVRSSMGIQGRRNSFLLHRLTQESLGGIYVAPPAQVEIDNRAPCRLLDRGTPIRP
jgi:hypothetical protein